MKHTKTLALVGATFIGSTMAVAALADTPMIREVAHMATDTAPKRVINNAEARLSTDADGATMTMKTAELTPGHVTTAWWVIVTRPELCETSPCEAEDIIGRAERVGTQIIYADGAVNSPEGKARFAGFLPSGSVEAGWYDQALDNPTKMEVHLVLNDHGPLIPEIAASMLTTYRGGCSDESLPPPFPASAKADGVPGPNTCQLIQAAIFMQDGKASN